MSLGNATEGRRQLVMLGCLRSFQREYLFCLNSVVLGEHGQRSWSPMMETDEPMRSYRARQDGPWRPGASRLTGLRPDVRAGHKCVHFRGATTPRFPGRFHGPCEIRSNPLCSCGYDTSALGLEIYPLHSRIPEP